MNKSKSNNRGHKAKTPKEIPTRGWKDIAKRVIDQISKDHVQIVSAGVGFYFFISLFPTIIAAISIYSLIIDTAQIQDQLAMLNSLLPAEAYQTVEQIVEPILQKSDQTLSWGLGLSILLSLWSANKGTSALFEGINIAYDEEDERSFFKKTAITLTFTLGLILAGLLSLLLVIFFPVLVGNLGLSTTISSVITWGRWLVLGLLLIFSLGLIYKIAPHRDNPRFRWVSWGAALSSFMWIIGSILFSWYVRNFGSYGDVYGSFAAVVILLLWLFLTSFIVLLGAEINSEMEHQTSKDTTIGKEEPMGQREAYHADRVAGKDKGADA
ncbi:YihY/virulence factor BrkB family protein [Autumnicola edwardsiae]|jgi:membrane protein|uniref:YihY/virulence factor BrkB family protein n=1 Tax=Autumnicola edwardsiae TaxID=3075594 RepID=A0ABU3CYJ0_9FLAO|nr:YihY/virulence factor BrkB family protein [Zunongwangia sp. F297]MDT0651313.1 YihY/virulence factor BrkB family protein [Zunongwangia sp. F297]